MRIAAGILMVIGGFIGGTFWLTFIRELASYFARSVAPIPYGEVTEIAVPLGFLVALIGGSPMLVAGIGGIMALKRIHWRWALAGAVCSLLFPFFGIPAVILLIKSKGEFQS